VRRGFPSPMLHATVGGREVWFIVDTGAGVHVLASWLAAAAHLSLRQTTTTVTGSTGAESRVAIAENTVLRLDDGGQLRLPQASVTDFPPIFAEQRLGGLISPQLLAGPKTAAVLDLRVPRLRFQAFDVAFAILGGKHENGSLGSEVCRNAASPFENRLYAAPIQVAGMKALMLVDSGATGTLVVPASPLAAGLTSRISGTNHTQGIGGVVQNTGKVPDVRLARGGTATSITLAIGGSAPSCGSDGLLGMDALRQCTLVLAAHAFAWSCDVSP
jgi:Aspartyl protease/gag-polyprotein putative aspartyl protease